MIDFKNIKWKHFKVNDLFEIEKCKCKKAGDLEKYKVPVTVYLIILYITKCHKSYIPG